MTVKPPILRPGATIGVVTLGSPLRADTINARIGTLQSMGFQVVLGRYVYADNGFLAGTDRERASDFMMMIENPDVDLILPTRGGVGVAGILPYLDYNAINRNPKILSGYSDISVLQNALYQFADLITFHSLLLLNFTSSEPAYNYDQFFAATSTPVRTRAILNPEGHPLVGRVSGSVTGPIVGGNLTSFVDTLGTPYEIDTLGKILLIEETHEPINQVYRMVNQLALAGKLSDCLGIVMGECTNCPESYGVTYESFIQTFMVPLGKPLLTNLASGHGRYKAAIPIGAVVNMNADNATLTVLESVVRI
ncbi:S66 peptidase family protein [Paenibacillus mendelii]|uniref:LD-carboxypeptidase n=1 Tax=Paenibacillus mendelii TaxID=206163 RepID=A0ABV6JJE1_9BACL|nr:LD-carboxypeptidase [Paenibacillus mendelii]MCQ6558960.1 LD-carboxypeptidase [Paenibacillus mendelii]